MQKYFDNVVDKSGNAQSGVKVTVKDSTSGALSTIYLDNSFTPKTNPITTDDNGYFEFYASNGRYTLDISGNGIQTRHVTDILLSDVSGSALLQTWAMTQAFQVVSATRNSDGAITTASITWPDGVTGTYTADVLSTAFPGATDAWHATYNASGTKTVTQPAVTRDSNGAVTAQPALTIV